MSLVCIECSQGKKFVSVERYYWEPLTTSRSKFGGVALPESLPVNVCLFYLLSNNPIPRKCGQWVKIKSPNRTLDPDNICTCIS